MKTNDRRTNKLAAERSPNDLAPNQLIRLRHVGHSYGEAPVLLDVDLDIGRGEMLGIVGPSGSGKTTLLKVLLGSVQPSGGHVDRKSALRIGYVPQIETVNWDFPVTVAEVVLMARTRGRRWPWPSHDERAKVAEVLEKLGIGDLGHRHIRELSGGQQQRVFIARALLGEPDVLFLDEPTSGVDVRTRHEVLHLLHRLNEKGLAIVLSTHDLNGIAAHLPQLLCINVTVAGRGAPADVLVPEILEKVYGAPMDVLVHAGLTIVVDRPTELAMGA
jgi:ABC-type Mn2+/Zn2+ transport system ATPase subunit